MVSESKSTLLHAIRWFAALIVLLGHTQMYAQQKTGTDAFIWEYVGQHAHAGVVIFFVLSGFIIAWSVDKNPGLTWQTYYVDRFSRIYSVLPIAIVFTIILDLVGGWLTKSYGNPNLIPQDHYWVRLLVNLFSLQGFQGYRVQFGSNPALWSIGYEFFYYIVFGLIFFWQKIFNFRFKLAGFVILGLFLLAGTKIALYFLIWLLGLISYKIQKKFTLRGEYFWFFLILVLMVNHWAVYKGIGNFEYLRDFSLGLAVAALFIPEAPFVGSAKIHKFMADFSYSLYAFHMPILFFAYFVILESNSNLVKSFSLVAIAICMVFSWIFSIITERKRFWLRSWIIKAAPKQKKINEALVII